MFSQSPVRTSLRFIPVAALGLVLAGMGCGSGEVDPSEVQSLVQGFAAPVSGSTSTVSAPDAGVPADVDAGAPVDAGVPADADAGTPPADPAADAGTPPANGPGSPPGGPTPVSEPTEASFAVRTAADFGDVEPTWQTGFSIAQTYDVKVAVDVPASFAGHHTLQLFFTAPGPMQYQRVAVAFSAGVATADGETDGEVIGAASAPSGYRVWVSLPVGGTMIDQYSMTGSWTADAWFDAEDSGRASTGFDLDP